MAKPLSVNYLVNWTLTNKLQWNFNKNPFGLNLNVSRSVYFIFTRFGLPFWDPSSALKKDEIRLKWLITQSARAIMKTDFNLINIMPDWKRGKVFKWFLLRFFIHWVKCYLISLRKLAKVHSASFIEHNDLPWSLMEIICQKLGQSAREHPHWSI